MKKRRFQIFQKLAGPSNNDVHELSVCVSEGEGGSGRIQFLRSQQTSQTAKYPSFFISIQTQPVSTNLHRPLIQGPLNTHTVPSSLNSMPPISYLL